MIPSPSSRQMKNNTFSVQDSDKIIIKTISRAHEGYFCSWAGIIGPLSNRFSAQNPHPCLRPSPGGGVGTHISLFIPQTTNV